MSAQDIILLAIVAVSTLYGLSRGGTKEIFGILALLAGVAGGIYLHGPVGKVAGESGVAHVIGFILIFLVVAWVINKIGHAVRTSLKLMFLGGVDRLIGAGVGFLRGLVIVCVILGLMTTYVDRSQTWSEDSKLASPALKVVDILAPVFPQGLKDRFAGRYEEVRDYWEKAKKEGMVQEGLEKMEDLKERVTGD